MTSADDRSLTLYRQARDYVDREIVRLTPRVKDREGKVAAARRFNAALGDPQRAQPSIQVAGTSGKGSVCALLAGALWSAGLRTGLHVSPYLQVFTEKTWTGVGGAAGYASAEQLAWAVDRVRPVTETFRRDEACPASVHGLTSLAVSWELFRRAELDVAVVETGCGGRYDLVQGLDLALAVITDLGLDHLEALGGTLESIAWHKAGIMGPGVPCVAVEGPGWPVLAAEAAARGVELIPARPPDLVAPASGGLVLRLPHLGEVPLPRAGAATTFPARNAAVAGLALDVLASRGWPLRPEHLTAGFGLPLRPGRFEAVAATPRVILDGAHNPQKLAALAAALRAARCERCVVVAGATGHRPPDGLTPLAPVTTHLVATQATTLHGKEVVPAPALAVAARAAGLAADAEPDPERALDRALALAGHDATVVVTGSIYLVGELRSRFYPWEQVLLQRTSWPTTQAEP